MPPWGVFFSTLLEWVGCLGLIYRVGAKADISTPETWPSFHPWVAGLA